jgi:multicomponent Na+:H+ antiporter subunit A
MPEMTSAILASSPLTVLAVALAGAPLTLILGWGRPPLAAVVAVASAVVAFALVAGAWGSGGGSVELSWAPSWGVSMGLTFDGLSAVYGLLATGVGAIVLIYASAYMPRHLHHHGRDQREATSFYALMLLFMGAMVGLVMADDLLLLFLFWDLTAVVSYFLI